MALRISALGVACALAATATGAALAEQAAPIDSSISSVPLQQNAAPPSKGDSKSDFLADIEARKSYWIPVSEIVGLDLLLNEFNLGLDLLLNEFNLNDLNLNEFNRHFAGDEHKSNLSSIRQNRRSGWRVDYDPFTTNQLGHPYQGSMYHGFGRPAEFLQLTKDSKDKDSKDSEAGR